MSEGESIIGKFFGVLGFKVDHHGVEEFQHSLNHVKHAVEGIFAVQLFEKIHAFIEGAIGAAAKTYDLAEATQTSAEHVAALGAVAIDSGSSMESMGEALMSVYRATGQAALGIGRNVKLFQTLGIHAKDAAGHVKSADTVMGELADKFAKMDQAKVLATAGRLGIDPKIALKMKELGGAGFASEVVEAQKKGLLSNEDYHRAEQTEIALNKLSGTVKKITTLLAIQLTPWIQKASKALADFVSANKVRLTESLHSGMKKLSDVLSAVWGYGERVWGMFSKLYDFFEKNKLAGEAFRLILVGIIGVKVGSWLRETVGGVKVLLETSKALLTSPATWIALLVAGVGLLLEDWIAFQNGEESVIGDLKDKWPAAFKVIEASMNVLLKVWEGIVAAAQMLHIIDKPDSGDRGKAGTMQRYAYYKAHNPKLGTPEADEYLKMEKEWKSGPDPWAELQANAEASYRQSAGLITAANADYNTRPAPDTSGAEASASMAMLGSVMSRGAVTTVYNTGTRIEIKADTDERARLAGKSVQDALGPSKVRNYQPRAL